MVTEKETTRRRKRQREEDNEKETAGQTVLHSTRWSHLQVRKVSNCFALLKKNFFYPLFRRSFARHSFAETEVTFVGTHSVMFKQYTPETVITIKDRPPPRTPDSWTDEVICIPGPPPTNSYSITQELDIITKKEVEEDIQVDPNLLYQSPDVEQFHPYGIRRFSLDGLIPPSVPLTNQDRRRAALTVVLQEFKKKFRFLFVIFAIISLLDIFIAGYHLAYGSKLSVFLQIFYIIVSFGQFMVSNELSEDGTLFELMPTTRSHEIESIVGRSLVSLISLIAIEIGLLIFTCVQRHVTQGLISYGVLFLTIILAIKIVLILVTLFWTRQLSKSLESE